MNTDAVPAASTNNDLFVVPIPGGTAKITSNPGADNSPQYSPDGKYLAYRSQSRAGYESDRWRLMAAGAVHRKADHSDREDGPLGGQFRLGARFDAPVLHRRGSRTPGHSVRLRERRRARIAVSGATRSTTCSSRPTARPWSSRAERHAASRDLPRVLGRRRGIPLTHLNDASAGAHQLTPLEDFWVDGAENAQVQSFLVKPPGFQPDRSIRC